MVLCEVDWSKKVLVFCLKFRKYRLCRNRVAPIQICFNRIFILEHWPSLHHTVTFWVARERANKIRAVSRLCHNVMDDVLYWTYSWMTYSLGRWKGGLHVSSKGRRLFVLFISIVSPSSSKRALTTIQLIWMYFVCVWMYMCVCMCVCMYVFARMCIYLCI